MLNIARGRSEGVAPLNEVRQQLFDFTGSSELEPYASWVEFGFNLKHFDSLTNFVAAYGTHGTITAETTIAGKRTAAQLIVDAAFAAPGDPVLLLAPADAKDFMFGTGAWEGGETGLNFVDLWVGGLAEKVAPFGGMLGSTFTYVFESQLENLQNADRFYYLERLDGLNFLPQLEGNSFAELIGRNSTADGLPAVAFFRPDCVFNMDFLTNNFGADDPSDDGCDEARMTSPAFERPAERLVRFADNTIQYLGGLHTIWNGSDIQDNPDPTVIDCGPPDRIHSSEGDDTIHGNCGDDVVEAGSGNDNVIGGLGDDIIKDLFGDDVLKGGPDDDVIAGGPGLDLLQGNADNDFIVAGNDQSELFGGSGNDVMYTGDGATESFGGAGDDWLEAGPQLNLLVGDENNQFQDDPSQGHDVLVAGKGDNDLDSEGGDDVMVTDVLGTERLEGMLGFDWATYRGDPLPVDADMSIRVVLPPNLDELRDRFDLTESVSGFDQPDILRGTDNVVADLQGESGIDHLLTAAGVDRVFGLRQYLTDAGLTVPAPTDGASPVLDLALDPDVEPQILGGDIIFGGGGADVLEGRAGNDIIEGDRWFNAQLCNGNAAVPTNCQNSLQAYKVGALAGNVDPGDLEIRRSIEAGNGLGNDEARFTGPVADYDITTITGGVRVVDTVGTDGTDIVLRVERLQFADQVVIIGTAGNIPATGTVAITTANAQTPFRQGNILTATQSITDPNGVPAPAQRTLVWEQSADAGVTFTNIPNATAATFTPTAAQAGMILRAVVSFTDLLGSAEEIIGAPTPVIGAIVNGNANANTLTGTAGSDLITGLAGADIINGAGGNDDLQGGNGADTINGGAGADLIRGGAGNDTVNGNGGNDTVVIQAGDTGIDSIDGGVGQDTFTNTLAAPITLQAISNVEIVNGGNRAIVGADGPQVFDLSGAVTITGVTQIEGGPGADIITGSDGPNVILGGAGNDSINGLGGADTITGGGGNDSLANSIDGARDTYRYTAEGESGPGVPGADTIANFLPGVGGDVIDVAGIDANPNVIGDQAHVFRDQQAFSAAVVGDLRWQVVGASTEVQTDTNNNGGVDLRILLSGAPQPLIWVDGAAGNNLIL